MQSPYYSDSYASYASSPEASYSSSPGGMDFFFYGAQPVYDPACDLDNTTPFPMEASPEVYSMASSPSAYASPHEYPFFAPRMIPHSAPSTYGSSYSGSSYSGSYSSSYNSSYNGFQFPTEELGLPKYPIPGYESRSESPVSASSTLSSSPSKPTKPFGCHKCAKAFTRFADLKRHQSSVHNPIFRNCPVDQCSRKGSNGFPRQDHLVEHLRSYHHINVPKRGACKRSAKHVS